MTAIWLKDGVQYEAVIERMTRDGRYVIRYQEDGSKSTVPASLFVFTKVQIWHVWIETPTD